MHFLQVQHFTQNYVQRKKIHLSIKSGSAVEDCPDTFILILLCTYLLYAISEYEFLLPVEFTGNFLHGKMSMLEYLKVPNGKWSITTYVKNEQIEAWIIRCVSLNITVVTWKDNQFVNLISTFTGKQPIQQFTPTIENAIVEKNGEWILNNQTS